jgi:hypothetical protein
VPALLISDTVVCLSGLASGETTEAPDRLLNHGVGIGFGTCERVTVPLTPNLGLLITRSPEAPRIGAREFNSYTIFNSREFVACSPEWPPRRRALYEWAIEDIELQRVLRPALVPTR